MAATIFKGNAVKTLKDNLLLGVTENISFQTGDSDDPTSVAKSAPIGSLYFRDGTDELYKKLDNGSSTNWELVPDAAALALYIPLTQKGAANGVATLDASTRIPLAQLPDLTTPKERYVDINIGSDLTGDGSFIKPYKTLTKAFTTIGPTDAVSVYPAAGEYTVGNGETSPLVIPLNTSIVGSTSGNTSIGVPTQLTSGANNTVNQFNYISFDDFTLDLTSSPFSAVSFLNAALTVNRLDNNPAALVTMIGGIISLNVNGEISINGSVFGPITVNPGSTLNVSNTIFFSGPLEISGNAVLNTYVTSSQIGSYVNGTIDSGNTPTWNTDASSYIAPTGDVIVHDFEVHSGTTAQRPTLPSGFIEAGYDYFDTDLGAPIWADGAGGWLTVPSLSGSTFSDSSFRIQDNGDATKQIAFEASGISTATTRTFTMPDENTTLVGTGATQSLTNKTIDADQNTISNIENADIKAAAAIALSKLAAVTINRALVSDASGFVSAATTTDTEIGYVNGVTSSIQTQLNARVLKAGDTMTGFLTLSADPTSNLHAATKQYVDSFSVGLRWKDPVRAASTTNLTLSGTQTVDGVALVATERILVKNQTLPEENGIYDVAAGAWSRSADADTWTKLVSFAVFVSEGSTLADTAWNCTVDAGGTLGTTAVTIVQFGASGTYTADNQGVQLIGNQFSLQIDGSTLSQSASGVKVASGGITNTEVNASAAIALTKLAATTINRALVSDGSGFVSAATTTATEIGYVNGVTSAIQTQLNNKQATGNYITDLTGDVTATGPGSVAATIAANAVSNSKLAQMATLTLKGNNTGITADPIDLTVAQVKTMLNLAGTNSGDVTVSTVGASPNASGASLAAQVLTLQPADATNPGVVTAGAQTIGGAKTLTGALIGVELDIDNLKLNGNTISSTDTNGNIVLDPNGTGFINASSSLISNVTDPVSAQDAATKNFVQNKQFDIVSVAVNTAMVAYKTYHVDVSGGAVTMTLPTPVNGLWIRIVDSLFNSNVNNITIARAASEKIDNVAASYTANSQGGSWLIYSDGTDWFFS